MPPNPETGKTDRRTFLAADLLEFRTKQAEELAAKVKKGKRRACESPDAGEQEGSGQPPSPLALFDSLTLGSGSSAANTPADSPANFPQPQLPERPAPPLAPKARKASKRSAGKSPSKPPAAAPTQHSTGSTAGSSQLLEARHRQASRSSGDASPASDGGTNAARIAALELKMRKFDEWAQKIEERLLDVELELGNRFGEAGEQ
jgi:hypothetical protein